MEEGGDGRGEEKEVSHTWEIQVDGIAPFPPSLLPPCVGRVSVASGRVGLRSSGGASTVTNGKGGRYADVRTSGSSFGHVEAILVWEGMGKIFVFFGKWKMEMRDEELKKKKKIENMQ